MPKFAVIACLAGTSDLEILPSLYWSNLTNSASAILPWSMGIAPSILILLWSTGPCCAVFDAGLVVCGVCQAASAVSAAKIRDRASADRHIFIRKNNLRDLQRLGRNQ